MDADVTVLVVDDQPRFLTVARTVVERTNGFRVIGEASNGQDAIDQVAALRPALVLMDINMPGMDGIAATRRIVDSSPDVVVVLLSSYDRADLPPGFGESGATEYLHKEELVPARLRELWSQFRTTQT